MTKKEIQKLVVKFSPMLLIWVLRGLRNIYTTRQKKLLSFAVLNGIDEVCDLLNVPFKRYIAAIILTESSGNPEVTGAANEVGLMQIYEPTFNRLNRKYTFNFSFQELYAIVPNIYVGTLLFRDNLKVRNYDFFETIMSHNVGTDLLPKDAAKRYLRKVLQNAK